METKIMIPAMPIRGKPFTHQQRAYNFVCILFGLADGKQRSRGVALLMEMGCGKSFVSVAVTGALAVAGKIKRVLVVAPLSILGVWEEEFARFADFPYSLVILKGSGTKKREQLLRLSAEELQIVVVNYESAWRLEDALKAYDADLIIADEGHKLKEGRTAQSKAMHHLGDRARYKLLLTGTVITNKEMDVFSQYRYLNKSVFGTSFYAFRNAYFDMTGYCGYLPVFKESMRADFLRRLHAIAFRVTKEECLDLPEITEEVRKVTLEPKAAGVYKNLEKESYTQLADSEVSAVNVLTRLLRLSQLTGGFLTDDDGKAHAVSKAKLEALSDVIDSALEENRKLVIMARFVAEMDAIQELLTKRHVGFALVRGGVKNRSEEIRRFQEEEDCRVFVGQIVAAGLGITLTSASTMVFFSLDYSMSNFEQAKARIHRVSQKDTCHYIYLVAEDTIDLKVLKALRDKADLARMLVDDYRKGLNPFKN
ncbi:MAG: DEAD/DEAH box helicase [Selenomonas sp.]|nr:DEAD/DEAH box helicase [Selenomonas sp.]